MLRYPSHLALSLMLLLPAAAVFGSERDTLFNRVSLQIEAEREVPNDRMSVLLVVTHQGSDPAALSERVNADMAWALELAEDAENVDVSTGSYSTSPIYNERVITGWRMRQELELQSQDFAALTALVGELQERLLVMQMGFDPLAATRERHQDELIEEALTRFRERVAIVQKHMDDKDYRIVELNVHTESDRPPVTFAREARVAVEDRAAPAVEAGTSKVRVTVSGSVQFY